MSATAEALFAELVTLSPANELPERTDYTRDDGTLDEDDLRADLEERRNEAAARSATAALATAALASPTSGSESSFKHLASPSSSKRNIAGDDGSFSSGDGSRNNSLKRRAVQFAAEEPSGSPAAGPRVPPAPVAVVVADDLWSSDDEEAAAAGDHAVLSAVAPALAAPDFVPVAVDGFEPAAAFDGAREGMTVKAGPAGVGYYPDAGGASTILVDDLQAALRQAATAKPDPLTPSPRQSPSVNFGRTRDKSFTTSMYSRALASEAVMGRGPPLQFTRPKAGPSGPARPRTP